MHLQSLNLVHFDAFGVSIESVSKMLGHSKISTTQIYAKVIEKKVGEDMKKLKEKLKQR